MLAGIELPPRYEPIRRIARGGMATVWCARDHTLDRNVAIKLLAEPYAQDELAGRRFKREARAAARLSGHPNVVTIYDVGEAPSEEGPGTRPFLVMEYLSGGTAADALRHGRVEPVTALTWLQQAAGALDYAHRRGVIHRDVKLANFLLTRERVLHVADFGIAQIGSEDQLTVSGEVLGTAAYLAPERALGQPATEASDRYALAVAAFELLTGERPFAAEHFAAQARQHVEDPPPSASRRNPALPAAIDAVLARGMAKPPEERFASSLEFTDAIEDALAPTVPTRRMASATVTRPLSPRGAGQPARPPVPEPFVRFPRRSPRAARMVVLAALAAVVLGVAIAAAASGGPAASGSRSAPGGARASRTPPRHSTPKRTPTPAPASTTRAMPSSPSTPPVSGSATALEAQGHSLMLAGDYRNAIPVLRQAVAAADPNSLTYAYALYDLGHSLRMAGDPRGAVPILLRRLQIPNQTSVVQTELALALKSIGQPPPPPAGPGHPPDGGQGGGGGQGD